MKADKLKELYKAADAGARANFRDMVAGNEGLLKALDEIDDEEADYEDEDDDGEVKKSLSTADLDALANRLANRAPSLLSPEELVREDEGLYRSLAGENDGGQGVDLTASFGAIADAINAQAQTIAGLQKSLATIARGMAALSKHEAERGVTRAYLRNCVAGEVKKAVGSSEIAGVIKSLSQPRAPRGATTQPSQVLADGSLSSALGGNAQERLQAAFTKSLGKNDELARMIATAQTNVRKGAQLTEEQLAKLEALADKVSLGI